MKDNLKSTKANAQQTPEQWSHAIAKAKMSKAWERFGRGQGKARERFGRGGVWEMFGDVPETTKEIGQFGKQLTERRKRQFLEVAKGFYDLKQIQYIKNNTLEIVH